MSIGQFIDKFNIIESHIGNDKNVTQLHSMVENYFENYLSTDFKVLLPEYINQLFWFHNISNNKDLINNINILIKNHLVQIRNNIRMNINKDNYELSNLNKFLNMFLEKILSINHMIRCSENHMITNSVVMLSNFIISDSIILRFLENIIIDFSKESKTQLKTLISFCETISIYDNMEILNKLFKTFGNAYKKELLAFEELPQPVNIKRVQKFVDSILYCKSVISYFDYVPNKTHNIISPLINTMFILLIDIFKFNDISDIEYLLNNTWSDFIKLVNNNMFEEKDDMILTLSYEIICMVDKNIKKLDKTSGNIIITLINILSYTDSIVKNKDHKDLINEKIKVIFLDSMVVNMMHCSLNNIIKMNDENKANKLLTFMLETKERDTFMLNYRDYLSKRLMEMIVSKNDKYLELENNLCDLIKIKFGPKLTYMIEKQIIDTKSSYNDIVDFNKLVNHNFVNKMNVITTSYQNWGICIDVGMVYNKMFDTIKNTMIGKHLRNYDKYYMMRYRDKRNLIWFPHFGEASITFMNQNILMLPIQLMVFELVAISDTPINIIKDIDIFQNYSKKFVKDIINSFLISGLMKVNNNNLVLSDNDKFSTNLINIFFNNSDYAEIMEESRNMELAYSRDQITNYNINHLLKKKSLNKMELFENTKNNIDVFVLTEDIFRNSIDYLISRDFIRLNNDMYEKIFY